MENINKFMGLCCLYMAFYGEFFLNKILYVYNVVVLLVCFSCLFLSLRAFPAFYTRIFVFAKYLENNNKKKLMYKFTEFIKFGKFRIALENTLETFYRRFLIKRVKKKLLLVFRAFTRVGPFYFIFYYTKKKSLISSENMWTQLSFQLYSKQSPRTILIILIQFLQFLFSFNFPPKKGLDKLWPIHSLLRNFFLHRTCRRRNQKFIQSP